jgi:hypothetical protein
MKKIIKAAIGLSYGLRKNFLLKNTLSVFVYHDVTDTPSEWSKAYGLNVTPVVFDFQIGFIKKHFDVISPDDLLEGSIPERAAMITFDDGLKNVFTNAAPILKRHGAPATIFMNMAPVKGDVFWSGLITYLCEKRRDFIEYLKTGIDPSADNRPPFLRCSPEIVNAYIEKAGQSFEKEAREFVGEFADENDLEKASGSGFIFYGNHLYNHHIPLLMSDDELLNSFKTNAAALEKYPNSRPLLAFPFGQPGTCFSERQIDLLLANGAKKVFSSDDIINDDPLSDYLHRIELRNKDNSPAKMWYRIFYKKLRR